MNHEVAEAAVERAEAGDLAGGEQVLVDYYDEETLRLGIGRMRAVKAFLPRMPLAEKALIDYREGRFYASTLVTLTLLDGMVDDLGSVGFFAGEVKLAAWDLRCRA